MVLQNIDMLKVLQIAGEAGKATIEIYNKDFSVEFKDDSSPLTEADCKSNEIIVGALNRLYPEIPILSEEGRELLYDDRKGWEYFWLIDPLDGTKEFVKKNGEFTINIALIHNGTPELGVVYAPVKETFFFANKYIGAHKLEGDDKLNGCKNIDEAVTASEKLPVIDQNRPFTVVGSRSHMSKETEDYINDLEKEHGTIETISIGSSLKLCMVADGKADVYPRFAPTMEWDTAAGHAVAGMSGALVINAETNEPLIYNKENLLNPWFIVKR